MGVTANWKGGVETEITTHPKNIGSKPAAKQFTYSIGEPEALLGDNRYPNPQDYLLGGMAGCMMVGFVAGATAKGIQLESVKLTIKGALDLRGFLDLDPNVSVGFEELQFNFEVAGRGTTEQYDEIIAHVQKVSPGYRTISDPVRISINRHLGIEQQEV
ncbi:OsmC family protein [Mucilaginibacter defluvii]|uniref:OsmC family protein n=1 Tax=Mucilaginibacter defluvii TaxID=1196019 RepID=UPI0031E5A55D